MAFQPSVAQYFVNRKRPATDELKNHSSKVLVLDALSSDVQVNNDHNIGKTSSIPAPKIVFLPKQTKSLPQFGLNLSAKKNVKKVVGSSKSTVGLKGKIHKTSHGIQQADIRQTFLNFKNNDVANTKEEVSAPTGEESDAGFQVMFPSTPTKSQQNVNFVKKGLLSPKRIKITSLMSEETTSISEKEVESRPEIEVVEIRKNEDNIELVIENKYEKEAENRDIVSKTSMLRKELNLGQIKAKLTRSSRLEEMKQALERINQSKAKLTNIQEKLSHSNNQTLDKFESVELEIPYASPMKTPVKFTSPPRTGKFTPSRLFDEPPSAPAASPLKSPFKSPAFQRYQTLVTEGRSALTLPFKYRALAEMFHCVDTVISMFNNRKETVTFSKLKPAVEEMKKRALTEYQLGQIKTIFPQGFKFHQEKIHKFGSTMQSDKYDLVITPVLNNSDKDSAKSAIMTPTCLLERKRSFYNTLLDMTKTYHEEFLTGLDPPMHIPRDRLTRWHPNFDIDGVPDITSSALPQPPNVEKITSAKDVLERSRSLFTANPRLQRALQRVSELNECSSPSPSPTPTSGSTPMILKGIPKCLLEKVRAKQAAKAMEVMTRTPAQAKEAVRLTRLPEIARIIRNLFVAEKKSVLPRDLVLKKLDDSYRENLTISELDDHVKLLEEHTPGWMMFCNIRKTDYIKLSKSADMLRIMRRLESLAAEKEF